MPPRENKIALKTSAAGPKTSHLKVEVIARPITRLCLPVRSFLVCGEEIERLVLRQLKLRPAAVRVRRKTSDLVHLREILRAQLIKHIPPNLPRCDAPKRQAHARHSRWLPVRRRSREMASRRNSRHFPRPFPRQIEQHVARQCQHARIAEPVPVRPETRFHPADKSFLADVNPPVVIEERLALGDDPAVVRCGSA